MAPNEQPSSSSGLNNTGNKGKTFKTRTIVNQTVRNHIADEKIAEKPQESAPKKRQRRRKNKSKQADGSTAEQVLKPGQVVEWRGTEAEKLTPEPLPAKTELQMTRSQRNWCRRPDTFISPDLAEIDYIKTQEEWEALDRLIADIYKSNHLSAQRTEKVNILLKAMTEAIEKEIPGARLDLFGSCVNGCGSSTCDLDMCFRYAEDHPPEGVHPMDVIKYLTDVLRERFRTKYNRFRAINARIPILKMRVNGFEADLSYYNDTALKNTVLLRRYCEWAPDRFPKLVLWIKKWAKDCRINSACAGTLSSYALTLMLIHYLQQCSPPVFPHWNAAQDFSSVDVIPNWSQNEQSLGQLFVGFIDYYSSFEYGTKLISILRSELSEKQSKVFEGDKNGMIAIEDPYLPTYNPGYTVRPHKFVKVLAVFRLSREVFMNKMEQTSWEPSIISKCTAFLKEEELDEFEQAQLNAQASVVEEKWGRGRKEEEAEYEDGKINAASKRKFAHRIFKAIVECRGACTINKLSFAYKKLFRAHLEDDKMWFYGTTCTSVIFNHPFLVENVEFKHRRVRILESTMQHLNPILDSLAGFSRSATEPDSSEEGARRVVAVIACHGGRKGVKQEVFEAEYLTMHGCPFDHAEREKYFGTTEMSAIVQKLAPYGVSQSSPVQPYVFHVKTIIVGEKEQHQITQLIEMLDRLDVNEAPIDQKTDKSVKTTKRSNGVEGVSSAFYSPKKQQGSRRFKEDLPRISNPTDKKRGEARETKRHGVAVYETGKGQTASPVKKKKQQQVTAQNHPFLRN